MLVGNYPNGHGEGEGHLGWGNPAEAIKPCHHPELDKKILVHLLLPAAEHCLSDG